MAQSERKTLTMPSFDEIRTSVSGSLVKAKNAVGISADEEEQKQPDRLDELSEMCPKLSFQQVRTSMTSDAVTHSTFDH